MVSSGNQGAVAPTTAEYTRCVLRAASVAWSSQRICGLYTDWTALVTRRVYYCGPTDSNRQESVGRARDRQRRLATAKYLYGRRLLPLTRQVEPTLEEVNATVLNDTSKCATELNYR